MTVSHKKILKAEMWDRMQFLFRKYYDRMVHTAVYFDGSLNMELLEQAYNYMLRKVPLLHSSFHNNCIKPYWREQPCPQACAYIQLIQPDTREGADSAVEGFLVQEIPAKSSCQLLVAVVRYKGQDVLCQIINHMVMDGNDCRDFTASLFTVYNKLVAGERIDVIIKGGARAHTQVYSGLSEQDKKTALGLYKNVSTVKSKTKFPFSKGGQNEKRILRRRVDDKVFVAMRTRGKSEGYSVNDIVLAAYIRGLYRFCGVSVDKPLAVPCMVDLRRHIQGGDSHGYSNHIGFMVCGIDCKGEAFEVTLSKVGNETKKAKNDKFIGLYSLPLLNLAYTIFPQFFAEIAIQLGYTNPYTGMSNLGLLRVDDLHASGLNTTDAWMTGGIKTKPYMQLAITSFNNTLTLTVAEKCNNEDAEMLFKLLDFIVEEIGEYAK